MQDHPIIGHPDDGDGSPPDSAAPAAARTAVSGTPTISPPLERRGSRFGLPSKRVVLFWLMLAFAALGQLYFARRPEYLWDGVALYLASVVCLLALVVDSDRNGRLSPVRSRSFIPRVISAAGRLGARQPVRAFLYGGASLCGLWILLRIRSLPEGADHYPVMAVWAAAILACALAPAFSGRSFGGWGRPRIPGLARATWLEMSVIALVVIGAFLLRALFVDEIPWNFGGDEGSQGLSAVAVLEGRTRDIFGVGWFTVPNLFFFFQSLSLRAFGDSVFGLRMASVLSGTAAVLFCYLLTRRLFGSVLALVATLLLASYHFHIHYSRLGSAQIGDSFFILAILYLLIRGLDTGRMGWFTGAGFLLGLTQYFYFGARLVPVLVVVYLAYRWLRHREQLATRASELLHMAAVALLVVLPYLANCSIHHDQYWARTNQVSIFQSGWYARELAMGRDAISVLSGQALSSLLAFNFYPDRVYWYHPGIPLLDFFSSVFFVLGLAIATRWIGQERYFVIAVSYWLAIFAGGFLTENPPSSMRLVILSPIASILVAIGMVRVSEVAARIHGLLRIERLAMLGGLVAFACVISVLFYFGEYSRHRTEGYGGPNTEVATEMAVYLKEIGLDHRVYFFGAPRMYLDFATIPFIARGVQGMDVRQPLTGAPTFVGGEARNVFIFLPERKGEMERVKQAIPGGIEEERRSREGGQLLFAVYRVRR